jgi:cytochrome c-type biogenesis protein
MTVTTAPLDRRPATIVAGGTLLVLSILIILAFSSMRWEGATLLLAYAGGMAMLLTPCRFPVVLGIVPLCRQGSPARGVVLALIFGLGLTITQTLWGVAIALIGEAFGLREVARYLSLAGGVVAYILGLWMLGLVSFPLPTMSPRMPSSLSGRSEYLTTFVMGLLLGNTGLCCPDPVFLSLIPFIAARGSLADGAMLAAAYGLGRATPLVAIVMLARGGVDALQLAIRHKQAFDRVLGWALLGTGTFTIYGYSGVSQDELLAVLLMIAPVLVFHVKAHSPLTRLAAWSVVTTMGTLAGVRFMYWVLVNLP